MSTSTHVHSFKLSMLNIDVDQEKSHVAFDLAVMQC